MDVQAILQWIGVLQRIQASGGTAYAEIKGVLAAHGIEADTAALDAVIADASRRKAIAQREATGDVSGPVVTGSTGE